MANRYFKIYSDNFVVQFFMLFLNRIFQIIYIIGGICFLPIQLLKIIWALLTNRSEFWNKINDLINNAINIFSLTYQFLPLLVEIYIIAAVFLQV